jgi:hypothetical protein
MERTYICLFDLREYDGQVAPGMRRYVRDFDPKGAVELLEKVKALLPSLKRETSRPLLAQEDYEHWIVSIAPDAGYKPSPQTVHELCDLIVQPLCVPRGEGFSPMQDLGPIAAWLTEKSEWFADLLDGGEELAGGSLEFSFGSGRLVATREQIAQFLDEVREAGVPEQEALAAERNNLLKLLEAAAADKNRTLLKTTLGATEAPA